jgi:hypothetical protein
MRSTAQASARSTGLKPASKSKPYFRSICARMKVESAMTSPSSSI